MSKQNITLDISEKNDDNILNNSNESDNDSVNNDSDNNDSDNNDDLDITPEQQKKIDGWLNEEEKNLKELEKLKKQQELIFKKMQYNIELKKKYSKQPKFSMFNIQNKINNANIIRKKELNKQQQKNSAIKYFRMKLF